MMEAVRTSETSVNFHETTRRYIQKTLNFRPTPDRRNESIREGQEQDDGARRCFLLLHENVLMAAGCYVTV